MAQHLLTEGSLDIIMQGGQVENPIMQVLGCKKINADKERYRLLLSDGTYFTSLTICTTFINENAGATELVFSIIKLKRYTTSVIDNAGKNSKVLVILEVETLESGETVNKQIGSPAQLPDKCMKVRSNSPPSSNSVAYSNEYDTSRSIISPVAQSRNTSLVQPSTSRKYIHNMNETVTERLIQPISSLRPFQKNGVIKVRVSNKSNIRTWSNPRGEGKFFTVDLVDESGEIRATAFTEVVDKFYDHVEIYKVYYISKFQLRSAYKQYCALKNDYELKLTAETVIQACEDGAGVLPQTRYNFVTIDEIRSVDVGSSIDVIGVCKFTGDLRSFKSRSTGQELKKKEITLVDESDHGIVLSLWGSDAEKFDGSSCPVVAIKGAKVGEYGGGKNICTLMGTVMIVNPDIPEARRMRAWYDNGGLRNQVKNMSAKCGAGNLRAQWMSFKAVRDQSLGKGERADYYQVKGTILYLRPENIMYKACPMEECNDRKVVDMKNGMYRCEKCMREHPNFKYKLIGSINVGDWSGNQWMSMFHADVEKVLGMTATEIGQAIEDGTATWPEIVKKANFKQFVVKCRAKFDTYNGEDRLNTAAVKVEPVNHKEYNAHLILRIRELLQP